MQNLKINENLFMRIMTQRSVLILNEPYLCNSAELSKRWLKLSFPTFNEPGPFRIREPCNHAGIVPRKQNYTTVFSKGNNTMNSPFDWVDDFLFAGP